MHTLEYLQDRVQKAFEKENYIKEPTALYEPIQYAMNQKGKRIRPLLTLMGADLFQADIEDAIYPAMAVEMFHNFTLLHDDIMDASILRRGMETVYKKYNTNVAILSGDTMFAKAYSYIFKAKRNVCELLQTLNDAAIEVCEGQSMDMSFEHREDVSIDEYLEMIRLKTGVLLACSLKLGAISAGAKKDDIDNLYSFGENIGVAFQLQDDILDCWSNLEEFGKVTGTDIADNKKTFLYLKALELSSEKQKEDLLSYFSTHSLDTEEKERAVKKIYEQLKIRDKSKELMSEYHTKAIDSLEKINVDIVRKSNLITFAQMLMNRNK